MQYFLFCVTAELTCGYKLQVVTDEIVNPVAVLSFRDMIRSLDIQSELGVELLLHLTERIQRVVWESDQDGSEAPFFGGEASGHVQMERDPGANSEFTRGILLYSPSARRTAWDQELENVPGEVVPGISCLNCCHHDSAPDK